MLWPQNLFDKCHIYFWVHACAWCGPLVVSGFCMLYCICHNKKQLHHEFSCGWGMFPSSGTSCHQLDNKKSLCTISKRCSDCDSGYQPGLNDKNEEFISENTITNENMESIDYIAEEIEEIEELDSLHVNIQEIQLGFIGWVKYPEIRGKNSLC